MGGKTKKVRSVRPMRDASGRFCKAVPEAFMEGQITKENIYEIEAVEKGKGGETSHKKCIISAASTLEKVYMHPDLHYCVVIKFYDHFTYHDLQ
jgi:hypothetical protein